MGTSHPDRREEALCGTPLPPLYSAPSTLQTWATKTAKQWGSRPNTAHTCAHTHTRKHARMHIRTHARTHTYTHAHARMMQSNQFQAHTHTHNENRKKEQSKKSGERKLLRSCRAALD